MIWNKREKGGRVEGEERGSVNVREEEEELIESLRLKIIKGFAATVSESPEEENLLMQSNRQTDRQTGYRK